MARIIVELTNRCNLSCQHCFDERHAAHGDLPLFVLDRVLDEAHACGIDEICFTGGEPTVHREFAEVVSRVCGTGYGFSFVSNGMNFRKICPLILRFREAFRGVTFSLDGARQTTHDTIRGAGSYRRVLQATSHCLFHDIPFTINMVLTTLNRTEVRELVDLAERLGAGGVRFGHLMFTEDTAKRGLDLSPQQRRDVETEIRALQRTARVTVGMAPGHYHESPFFPCAPLELEEYNLDYRGNLTLCCQLSGLSGPNQGDDVLGNLREVSLGRALQRARERVAVYLEDKRRYAERGRFNELDHFPCFYCVKYLGKAKWLKNHPGHSWAGADSSQTRA
jgi:MoaA/NifB/PqqE/SkfB family radical SAM enzyme